MKLHDVYEQCELFNRMSIRIPFIPWPNFSKYSVRPNPRTGNTFFGNAFTVLTM